MNRHPHANRAAVAAVFAASLGLGPSAFAAETRSVVVGAQFKAGGTHRWLFGSDYRNLWTTPATIEVLDLATEAGGLMPVRRVGGQQTKALAMRGKDGRNYTFRGIEKDATELVEEDLRGTIVQRILEDQMAAQHPASEVIARKLSEAAGIPVPAWRLVVMPDDPALGEFRKVFAGAVGAFAEYPSVVSATNPGFRGATEIIDHLELYKRIEAGVEDRADIKGLLRARLLDIFMGDWDRHRKQWRWAKLPGSSLWQPIPEDRDQAFSRYAGLVLNSARGRDPRFQNLKAEYPNIGGLTYNGAEQDRRLFVALARDEFRTAAEDLKRRLTDAAIDDAVKAMPAEWFAIDGARLARDLKARRNTLPQAAERYYEHLAHTVDVYLTNRADLVEARRLDNGDLDVKVSPRGEADKPAGEPYFQRVFHKNETSDLTFYALEGDDRLRLSGASGGIHVRMIGGKGNDTLDATGSGNAKLADSEGVNKATGVSLDDHPYTPPPADKSAPWNPPRDWTRETILTPLISYNADLGVFLRMGLDTRSFGVRKHPYANRSIIRAGFSTEQESARFDYQGEFHQENRKSYWGLHLYASGVDVLRYYGLGNESQNSFPKDFYKVSANQFVIHPTFAIPLGGKGFLSVGPLLKYTETKEDKDQFINVEKPYGSGKFGEVGAHAAFVLDGRDNLTFPRKGAYLGARASWIPKAWDAEDTTGQVNGEGRLYVSAGKVATLALRAGAKKVFGTYPFQDAAYIGQGGFETSGLGYPSDTLRGYRSGRFGGDASAFGNADLRLKLTTITLILPAHWGLLGFADAGRVWRKGDVSDTWHTSAGGGIWLAYLNDKSTISFGVAHSTEEDLFYVKAGFAF